MLSSISVEVTNNDFQKTANHQGRNKRYTHRHKTMTRKSWGILSSSRKKKDSDSVSSKHSISALSSIGQQSVASMTVNSGTTIKASNLHQEQIELKLASLSTMAASSGNKQQRHSAPKTSNSNSNHRHGKPPTPWKSLKRLVSKGRHSKHQTASITSQSSSDSGNHIQRRHAKSHDGVEFFSSTKSSLDDSNPIRKRFYSDGVRGQEHLDAVSTTDSQHTVDQIIRGRLDGVDVLSLGPVRRALVPLESSPKVTEKKNDGSSDINSSDAFSFDPIHTSFTDLESFATPAKILDELIWMPTAMDQAEIIFEGFYPGCNDRWGVRIAPLPSDISSTRGPSDDEGDSWTSLPTCNISLSAKENESDESTAPNTPENDGSTSLPLTKLWNSLWGVAAAPPPIPPHMKIVTPEKNTINIEDPLVVEDEENQQFVDMCNVPVDLDDDAFMIDGPQHVKSIHEVVMVPIQARRFGFAISIFEKLLRGLDGNEKYLHLTASTSHNIGMLQLCQEKYQEALESFQKAVLIRKACLPTDHPDIAVSLQREGMAHFALGSMAEALDSFEAALALCTSMDNTRAKLLNNIGVVRFQLKDHSEALESFTAALEIQRPWLESSVRRESVVYSASTILSNMGNVHLCKSEHEMSYFVFEEACLMQTSIFRTDHELVLNTMDNMARAQAMNGNFTDALNLFTSLYRSQKEKFGVDNGACIETLGMIGMSHCKLMEYEKAAKCVREVASWQIEKGGMDTLHPLAKATSDYLEQIKRCLAGEKSVRG